MDVVYRPERGLKKLKLFCNFIEASLFFINKNIDKREQPGQEYRTGVAITM